LRSSNPSLAAYPQTFCKAFAVAITFQVILHLRDAYQFGTKPLAPEFLNGFGQALLLAWSVLFIISLSAPTLTIAPAPLTAILLSITVLLTTWHFLVRVYFGLHHRSQNTLIMGTGPLARSLAK